MCPRGDMPLNFDSISLRWNDFQLSVWKLACQLSVRSAYHSIPVGLGESTLEFGKTIALWEQGQFQVTLAVGVQS